MSNVRSMKKLFTISIIALALTACATIPKTPAEKARDIAKGTNVSQEITKLQLQLENGEITKKYAQEKLKQVLKERQRQNSGDTDAILEKIGDQDPMIQKALEEMLERRKAQEAAKETNNQPN